MDVLPAKMRFGSKNLNRLGTWQKNSTEYRKTRTHIKIRLVQQVAVEAWKSGRQRDI